MALLGSGVARVEDEHLLIGDTTFVADIDLDGAAQAHYVTSPLAHARIVTMDVAAAREAPGVIDVLTGEDIDLDPLPPLLPDTPPEMKQPLLAVDVVRFVGEPVVAIVAETAAAAADAADLVDVEYEPLPVVVSLEEAIAGEVLLFPEAGTNVMNHSSREEPVPFDECDVVVEARFVNQRLAPCPIETRVAAATWTPDDRLLFYASCQGAHPIRDRLASVHRLEPDQVRVITADVGGSFGAKARPYPEELLLPLLSSRCGRPVRWAPARTPDMVGLGHSRAQHQDVTIGGSRDGRIDCLRVHVLNDGGAYGGIAPLLARNTGAMLPGPYAVTHVSWTADSVVTNTTQITAYRGAGRPEAAALIERAVDLFAAEIGMDPAEIRRRNLVPASAMPHTNPGGLVLDSGDYRAALDQALAASDYEELRAEQARRRSAGETRLLGIGIASFIDRTAGVPGSEYGSVELRPDGTILVLTGSSPSGQGHYTAWAMLVADRTGLPLDRIEVVHGDTDVVPRGGITGGSRSAQKAGSAVAEATGALVEIARIRAAELLEANPDDVVLDLTTASFHVTGAPGAASVGWAELGGQLQSRDPLRCESDFHGEGPTVPYGSYVVAVEVDIETGGVELLKVVTVDDAGTILNPVLALGQVHGGLAQGLAQALSEEFVYDDDGNPLTSSFATYGLPSAAEMPSFDCHLTETPSPNNPLGFKGIAESSTIGAPPAAQNAVIDALAHLGVRHIDLPVSPERIWHAIREARRP
jgi:carbon-monoxide dehydrogenase large subunit